MTGDRSAESFDEPPEFASFLARNLVDLAPWRIFVDASERERRRRDLAAKYPGRVLAPFAINEDTSDQACWDPALAPKVIIVKSVAEPGWEERAQLRDFRAWARHALDEMLKRDALFDAADADEAD